MDDAIRVDEIPIEDKKLEGADGEKVNAEKIVNLKNYKAKIKEKVKKGKKLLSQIPIPLPYSHIK